MEDKKNDPLESLMDDSLPIYLEISTDEGIFEMIDRIEKIRNETVFTKLLKYKEMK